MSKIYSRKEWGARYKNGVGNRKVGSLEKYFHHSVTKHLSENATVAEEMAQMRVIERIGQQRFGDGISYTFIIFPSGRIYEGAGVNRISWHSGPGRNTRGAGICLAGNYEANKLGSKAENAVVWLLQEGVRRGWWNDPALTEGHRDFKSTSCPGKHAYGRMSEINRKGRGGAVSTPKSPQKPAQKPSAPSKNKRGKVSGTSYTVEADGIFGNYTIRALQQVLRNKGYKAHAVYGAFGAYTIRSLQSYLRDKGQRGHAVDGDFGRYTIRSLQAYLRARGYKAHAVDGDFGKYTVKSLQEALIDGKF